MSEKNFFVKEGKLCATQTKNKQFYSKIGDYTHFYWKMSNFLTQMLFTLQKKYAIIKLPLWKSHKTLAR
ncbi:MAG: hypothetical protein J6P60_04635 [Lachnospiraceae bacterium]|nr:hypothetical protein [Lachnospiraceae bacterium]